jgi:hypothetical protein
MVTAAVKQAQKSNVQHLLIFVSPIMFSVVVSAIENYMGVWSIFKIHVSQL